MQTTLQVPYGGPGCLVHNLVADLNALFAGSTIRILEGSVRSYDQVTGLIILDVNLAGDRDQAQVVINDHLAVGGRL